MLISLFKIFFFFFFGGGVSLGFRGFKEGNFWNPHISFYYLLMFANSKLPRGFL